MVRPGRRQIWMSFSRSASTAASITPSFAANLWRAGCKMAGADVGIGRGVASREQLTVRTTMRDRLGAFPKLGIARISGASRHFYWWHFFFTVTPKHKSLYFINVSLVYHVQRNCESGERKPRIPSGIEGWAGSFPPLFLLVWSS